MTIPTVMRKLEVVHALIPIRVRRAGGCFLFTQQDDDPDFQPVGGKVEADESLEEALLREIVEETEMLDEDDRLTPVEIERLQPVAPALNGQAAGILYVGVSPTTGLLTEYRFHPFVTALTGTGCERVARILTQRHPMFRAVALNEWCRGSASFNPEYALAVRQRLGTFDLDSIAIDL